ncbi:hypothetical protein DNH61_14855 [Paenibacillus sambharensis]|uniref:Uncharacterized protein n=1 Tax=Paenibacillus sambharensis TaxID=1803190 RepID=A0A2W1LSU5_9BACL|nr:hypothetical protein [Paenibacillus sambharensis]PZD94921.1 hypothetical protein DNH61_14855 [Paenibacillus sambharensis]
MDWFNRIEKSNLIMPHEAQPDFQIVKIQASEFKTPNDLANNIILQWIVCPFLLDIDGVCFQIPIYSNNMYEYLSDTILCNFSKIQGIYEDGIMTTISLNKLNSESELYYKKHLLELGLISPVVKEFYMKENTPLSLNVEINTENIELDIEKFRKRLHVPEDSLRISSELWDFFVDTHISKEGNIILSPIHWTFNNDILTSPTLEYFSRYANRIILTINKNNSHIRAIELS